MVHVMMDSLATTIRFAQPEMLSDRMVTRAQGNKQDSRVPQGTRVIGGVACLSQ